MARRGRAVGYDLFLEVRRTVPLDVAGIHSEAVGGLGDIKYSQRQRRMAAYRFLFSPIRYPSLPLAVVEGLLGSLHKRCSSGPPLLDVKALPSW
jgi:hypothetical protein